MRDAASSCSVALILSGGARDVQLTAASLARNLLPSLGGAARVCVFVRSLLDPDAHKLTALAVAIKPLHLAVLHVDAARPSAELLTASVAVIRPDQANRSAQELLQLEEAQDWVEAFERRRAKAFDLVVRARLDAFWSASLPSHAIAPGGQAYIVPRTKQFGGVNDRFGMSSSAVARRVNRRVTAILRHPSAATTRGALGTYNSEQLLNWTLALHSIEPQRLRLPFCLLVRRKCKCCLLVPSCARSGNKCRPCSAVEEHAQRANSSLEVPPVWPPDAMERFDAVVPDEYAAVRRSVTRRDETTCERELGRLVARTSLTAKIDVSEACRLARASDCTFDANAGRWVGAGCASRPAV